MWLTRAGQIMSAEMQIMGTSHRGVISQATIETFEVEIKGTYHLMKKVHRVSERNNKTYFLGSNDHKMT